MSSSIRTIAVTGAGGFLGTYFCRKLVERGYAVRALSSQRLPARAGVDVFTLPDLCDSSALESALRGTHAVIHLAGLAHVLRGTQDAAAAFRRANVTCVEAVCAAARIAGAHHVVLMSSAAVVGDPDEEVVTASTPLQPSSLYGKSKLEGETRARDRLRGSEVRLRIFRPPLVHGPGMRGNPLRLFRLVDRGIPLPLGGIHNRRSVISAHNLFDAVERSIRSDAPTGDALYVSDDEAPSTPAFAIAIGVALGRRVRLVPLPGVALRALASASAAGSFLPDWLRGPLEDVHRLTSSFVVDSSIARDSFGFVPTVSLAEGLLEAAEWWRRELRPS